MNATASSVITSTTPLWYATRATGVVTLILLTGSVMLGVVVSVRHATERWPRLVTLGVHRELSLLVTIFLILHVVTAELDTFAPVGLLAFAVPFFSAYRQIWLGLGTLASDLFVAVTLTSLLRTRVGHRTWRAVHWLPYVCWPLAVVHSLGTGTDARQPVILGITILCTAGVLLAAAWRLLEARPRNAGIRLAAGSLGVITLAVGLTWSVTGPLKAGWSAKAGTPAQPAAGAPAARASALTLPLHASVAGSIETAHNSGQESVTIEGTDSTVAFHIVITGPPAPGGGVAMTSSRATFGPTGQPTFYSGRVTALHGTVIQALLSDPAGASVKLTLDLSVAGPKFTGTLAAVGAGG